MANLSPTATCRRSHTPKPPQLWIQKYRHTRACPPEEPPRSSSSVGEFVNERIDLGVMSLGETSVQR
ncbi:hypothetical protein E2562_021035 [Oryza meyeriana var. granulata]|uniref:Uncharacterized protein n=1 Tax=Oryza meyeriana var. granulata TaxID=110450 RepID=A0A6G1FAV1_9ORYZ|nr:hypothetical protein E2562_021035 [Oryza meyeriana var. granulata]